MYRKLIAGVAAVAIAFGAVGLPVAESGVSFGGSSISASADTYGDYNYTVLTNDTVEISGYSGRDTELEIPSEIDGKAVTRIGSYAFFGNDITSVTIPNGVTNIGTYAFEYCDNLKGISIPNSVTEIGDYAFYCCASLASVIIPDSVTNIRSYAFYNCTSLTNLTLPDSVTNIGNSAFYGCTSLTNLTLPDSITLIGDSAFCGCTSLTSLTIPKEVGIDKDYFIIDNAFGYYENSMGETSRVNGFKIYCYSNTIGAKYAKDYNFAYEILDSENAGETQFYYKGLSDGTFEITGYKYNGVDTDIEIPAEINGKSVTSIGEKTFKDCLNLTSVTIPDSVKNIGNSAFSGCTYLVNAKIPIVSQILENTFFMIVKILKT